MVRALVDTSVIIDIDQEAVQDALPEEFGISAITFAELATGTHLADNAVERALRQARLQQLEEYYEPVPFDGAAARSYGLVVAAVTSSGRSHRSRIADLMIAATAHANGLSLYTRNPKEFARLESIVTVLGV